MEEMFGKFQWQAFYGQQTHRVCIAAGEMQPYQVHYSRRNGQDASGALPIQHHSTWLRGLQHNILANGQLRSQQICAWLHDDAACGSGANCSD